MKFGHSPATEITMQKSSQFEQGASLIYTLKKEKENKEEMSLAKQQQKNLTQFQSHV